MKLLPVSKLTQLGQSIWLDFLSRDLLDSGKLEELIRYQDLRGVTSNPKILAQSISDSTDYDEEIRQMARQGHDATHIYEILAVEDVRNAAALLRPVYDSSNGRDGFVSLEVSPQLAHDTYRTTEEARRLWKAVDAPNVLIKVPATDEGLPAIRQLISDGINVNVTLLFGLPRYRQVVEAYLDGLEDRAKRSQPLEHIASVASFFLSRIDTLVDKELDEVAKSEGKKKALARSLRGEIAIASAKTAYRMYREIFSDKRFQQLARKGAHTQKLLWGSTSTKNPDYSDVMYIEALIGPETINTVPLETFEAYQDHGRPESRLERDVDQAGRRLRELAEVGIDIDRVTRQLVEEGVQKFSQPFEDLLVKLEQAESVPRRPAQRAAH